MKSILITGILGQDGTILSELISGEYNIIGVVSEETENNRIVNFLENKKNIKIIKSDITNENNVISILKKINPDVVINFAGISNVFNPWEDLDKIYTYNCKIPQNFLKGISDFNREIFFIQSSSSLIYGRSNLMIANEKSPTIPMYPYGISKLYSHNLINEFRHKFNLKCTSAIFFNHESFYRSKNFLSKRVSTAVSKILNGENIKLELNSLESFRDISHAEDFMNGIKLIIDNKINEDFIFSSSSLIKIEDFVRLFFTLYQLDFEKYVNVLDNKRYDDFCLIGDNSKLKSIGWKPKYNVEELIKDIINKELNVLRTISN